MTETFYEGRWIECRCGKIRWVARRDSTQELVDMYLKLAEMGLCRRCEADHAIRFDSCPEGGEDGSCILSWRHTGKCESLPPTPDFVRRIAMANPGKGTPVLPDNPRCVCGHRYSTHAETGFVCSEECACTGFVLPS